MEGNGFVGSIAAIPVKVVKESFFRRRLAEGKLRLLTDEQESSRSFELEIKSSAADNSWDRVLESLDEGASETGSRYTKKNLTEDGQESGPSITAKQVRDANVAKPSGTVRRSSDSDVTPDYGEAVPEIPVVLTETVKEGEWTSDTGAE